MSKLIALLCAAAMTISASSAVFAAVDDNKDNTANVTDTAATEAPSETASEAPSEKAAETASEAPSEKATETASETPSEQATETASETPSEKATETASEAPSEEPSEKATEAPTEEPATNPFVDCQDEWFTDAVTYVYTHELIKGVDDTHFMPQDNVTRDELAVILYRLHSADANIVTEGENWAAEAEAWATEKGIMSDFISGDFEGSTALTREQIITTLHKSYQLDNTADNSVELDAFTDADTITEYAVNATKWAVAEGIVEGNEANEINPADNVTRAETAALLERYLTKLSKVSFLPQTDTDTEAPDADKSDDADTEKDPTDAENQDETDESLTEPELEESEKPDAPPAE